MCAHQLSIRLPLSCRFCSILLEFTYFFLEVPNEYEFVLQCKLAHLSLTICFSSENITFGRYFFYIPQVSYFFWLIFLFIHFHGFFSVRHLDAKYSSNIEVVSIKGSLKDVRGGYVCQITSLMLLFSSICYNCFFSLFLPLWPNVSKVADCN